MKFDLVGFTGKAGAGKSTAAQVIVDRIGFSRLSFAQPLRAMLGGLGLTTEELTTGKTTPLSWLDGKTPRQLLQTLGTEWGRNLVHPDIWIRVARREIEARRASGCLGTVIDDVRFDNEARLVRELGGLVISIDRLGLPKMDHASEAGVSPSLIDLQITNVNDAPEVLKQWVLDVIGGVEV